MPPRAPSSSSPRKTKGISTSGAKAPSKAPRAAASAAKSTGPKSAAAKPTATPAPRARKAGATDSSATRRIAEAITTAIV
ncbi:MAG: hypothetical protein JWP52_2399, partial [Rhizobacter sp.]|nr:hypothetical protein [Rhizobacter sp.]